VSGGVVSCRRNVECGETIHPSTVAITQVLLALAAMHVTPPHRWLLYLPSLRIPSCRPYVATPSSLGRESLLNVVDCNFGAGDVGLGLRHFAATYAHSRDSVSSSEYLPT